MKHVIWGLVCALRTHRSYTPRLQPDGSLSKQIIISSIAKHTSIMNKPSKGIPRDLAWCRGILPETSWERDPAASRRITRERMDCERVPTQKQYLVHNYYRYSYRTWTAIHGGGAGSPSGGGAFPQSQVAFISCHENETKQKNTPSKTRNETKRKAIKCVPVLLRGNIIIRTKYD